MGQALSDYPFTGDLSKTSKIIQKRDVQNLRGKRSILVSEYGKIFEGFNLNRDHPFDTVLKQSPSCIISRDICKATLSFPEFIEGINLVSPWKLPLYRFIIVLGIVPDMTVSEFGYEPISEIESSTEVKLTDWNLVAGVSARQEIEIQITGTSVINPGLTFFVSLGIEFGIGITRSFVQTVKKVGYAKVLMVG